MRAPAAGHDRRAPSAVRTVELLGRAESPRCVGLVGAALACAGLLVIWAASLSLTEPLYVSELGAEGMPTAPALTVGLLLVAGGGAAVAWAARGVRSRAPLVGAWAPTLTLAVASAAFALASQIPCTAGCPVPGAAAFTAQDLAHVVVATLGFVAACVAMLQTTFSDLPRWVARFSLGVGASVALVAGGGGVIALLQIRTHAGGVLEHVAATLAIVWLAVLGVALATERAPGAPRRSGPVEQGGALGRSSRSAQR